MLEKLKSRARKAMAALLRAAGWIRRACRGRLGFYGALALLLALLALASQGYRNRLTRAEDDVIDAPKAVAAIRQSEAEPEDAPEKAAWAWPLEGEIVGKYSPDEPVWSQTLSQWQNHPALDIAGAPGEAVYACADGTVADAWNDRLWGNVIVINHEEGYVSTYAGLNTLKLVEVGASVAAGEVISAVGLPTGCESSQPAHLHFELTQNGQSVDFAELIDGENAP